MLSPEHGFRPYEVYAPVDKTGAPLTGHAAIDYPQQPSLVEAPSTSFSTPENLGVPNEPLQNEVGPLGQATQSFIATLEPRSHERVEIGGTIDLSGERERQTLRSSRRAQWEQTGNVPQIAGGAPRRHVETLEELQLKDSAGRRVEATEAGLSEHATWEEIRAQQDKNRRKAITEKLNLGLEPTLAEKMERAGMEGYPEWETILYYALNITAKSPNELPPEEVTNRIKEARKLFRKLDNERQKKQ